MADAADVILLGDVCQFRFFFFLLRIPVADTPMCLFFVFFFLSHSFISLTCKCTSIVAHSNSKFYCTAKLSGMFLHLTGWRDMSPLSTWDILCVFTLVSAHRSDRTVKLSQNPQLSHRKLHLLLRHLSHVKPNWIIWN